MSEATKYASVTSITGLLPKKLSWWAGNAVANCAFFEQDKWLNLEEFKTSKRTFYGREARYEYVRRAHQRLKDTAADLGTEVHKFVEAHNLGKPTPTWPLPVKARMTHFERFVADFSPRIEAAETKVYHRYGMPVDFRGGPFNYAGTADMFAEIDGHMAVVDIKTGKSVWPEAALQINAYAYADFLVADPHHPGAKQITPKRGKRWYEWHGPAEDELPLPEVTKGYVLHLRDDGYDLIEVPISDELYEMFLSLFAVDRWERDLKKRALLGRVPPPLDIDEVVAEFGGAA